MKGREIPHTSPFLLLGPLNKNPTEIKLDGVTSRSTTIVNADFKGALMIHRS